MNTSRRPRASGRVTLGDVASAAGVSPITVSRALRGERSVGAELVARVREAAERLGYVPDPAARALASSRSSHVAVLIPLLSNTLFVDLLEAVHSTLLPAGYQTLIGVTHYDPREEELLLHSYMAHRPAGLLVTGFDRTEASRRLIAASGVPCVHLMETTPAEGVHSVGFSQADAGHAITAHLLARGRKRIAFVAAQLDPRVMQRAEGYRRCLKDAGLYDPKLELLNPEGSSLALGGQLFEHLLKTHPEVDAIFFCNDDLAQGGLLAALRLGVKVPQRIAVAGFNDLNGSDQMLPPLTTVHTPRTEIGEQAARMLLQLMRREPLAQTCVDVGYELIVRGST
ncbi:MAG TPA: LacI family DNA-binding transcriptional regulator [Rhizobacter sp.]|nr:LacI family DNA-binding transcriptional regulator [Rhizobacter sp.]